MSENEIEEPTEEQPVPEPEPEPEPVLESEPEPEAEPEAEPEDGKSETKDDDEEEKEEQPISMANIETISSPQATALVTYDSFENIGRAIADYLQGKWSGQKFTTKKPGGEDGEEVETEPVFVLLDAPHDLYNSEYTANYEVSTYDPTQDIISLVRNNTRIPIKVADDGESLLYESYDALGIFVVTARAPDPPAIKEELEEGVVQKTWVPDEKAECSDKTHNCLSSLKVGG